MLSRTGTPPKPLTLEETLAELNTNLRSLIEAVKSQLITPATAPALPAALIPLMASIEDRGTSSGGSETTLIDNTKYWETDLYAGALLLMSIGGTLVVTSISSNTHDTLTFTTLPGGLKPVKTPYAIKVLPLTIAQIIDRLLTKVATKVLDIASIAASATSALADCHVIDLHAGPTALGITVACTFNPAAVLGIKVHVRTSYDGTNYDTQDFDSWTPTFTAGATIRATKAYDISPAYVKVLIENLDAAQAVTAVSVHSTVRGG